MQKNTFGVNSFDRKTCSLLNLFRVYSYYITKQTGGFPNQLFCTVFCSLSSPAVTNLGHVSELYLLYCIILNYTELHQKTHELRCTA